MLCSCISDIPFVDTLGRFLVNKTIDVLLYVDRLDVYRVDELDKQVVLAITQTFGKEIWCKTLLVLTHAQFSPPDELSYETFSSKRSDSLLKTIRAGSKMRKNEFEVYGETVVFTNVWFIWGRISYSHSFAGL